MKSLEQIKRDNASVPRQCYSIAEFDAMKARAEKAESDLAASCAQVERLRALVQSAYLEGWADRAQIVSHQDMWSVSDARAALEIVAAAGEESHG